MKLACGEGALAGTLPGPRGGRSEDLHRREPPELRQTYLSSAIYKTGSFCSERESKPQSLPSSQQASRSFLYLAHSGIRTFFSDPVWLQSDKPSTAPYSQLMPFRRADTTPPVTRQNRLRLLQPAIPIGIGPPREDSLDVFAPQCPHWLILRHGCSCRATLR